MGLIIAQNKTKQKALVMSFSQGMRSQTLDFETVVTKAAGYHFSFLCLLVIFIHPSLDFFILILIYCCYYLFIIGCMPHPMEIRGQLYGVSSLLPPLPRLWGWNSGHWCVSQTPLLEELSYWPKIIFLFLFLSSLSLVMISLPLSVQW